MTKFFHSFITNRNSVFFVVVFNRSQLPNPHWYKMWHFVILFFGPFRCFCSCYSHKAVVSKCDKISQKKWGGKEEDRNKNRAWKRAREKWQKKKNHSGNKRLQKESTNKHVACGFNMIFTLNILFILFFFGAFISWQNLCRGSQNWLTDLMGR